MSLIICIKISFRKKLQRFIPSSATGTGRGQAAHCKEYRFSASISFFAHYLFINVERNTPAHVFPHYIFINSRPFSISEAYPPLSRILIISLRLTSGKAENLRTNLCSPRTWSSTLHDVLLLEQVVFDYDCVTSALNIRLLNTTLQTSYMAIIFLSWLGTPHLQSATPTALISTSSWI